MKKGLHPENYRPVVFKDMSNGDMFLSRSTVATKETIEFEGETYPLLKLEISSSSHPFYTGKSTLVDTAGRVDKFMSNAPHGDRTVYLRKDPRAYSHMLVAQIRELNSHIAFRDCNTSAVQNSQGIISDKINRKCIFYL